MTEGDVMDCKQEDIFTEEQADRLRFIQRKVFLGSTLSREELLEWDELVKSWEKANLYRVRQQG